MIVTEWNKDLSVFNTKKVKTEEREDFFKF